jgi:hypothetical protein
VLAVIEEMGPGAREAMTVVARLGDLLPAKSPGQSTGVKEASFRFDARPDDRKRAADLYARLKGREGRVGVNDRAGVFSVKAAREATRSLRELARKGHVEVLVETVAGAAPKAAPDRKEKLPPRALLVRIYTKGPDVHVSAGEGLSKTARLAERVRERVRESCDKGAYDKALKGALALLGPSR